MDFSVCKNIRLLRFLLGETDSLPVPSHTWEGLVSRPRVTWTVFLWLSPVFSHSSCSMDHITGLLSPDCSCARCTDKQQRDCFCLMLLFLGNIALGSCVEEDIPNRSHSLPGTDSLVLQVLLVFSKLQCASVLEIFEHVLDGDC